VTGSSNEESYSASVGLQYAFTSRWSVHVGFDYSGVSSEVGISDYSRERYTGGVIVNF
jgi:opacity protein-like surface antigen